MSKRKPFIIHPGAGGLEGRARLWREMSAGDRNEAIYQWLKERATSHGMGNPPQAAGEIVVPAADLIFEGNELQAQNGYNDNDFLPKAGPANTWAPSGELSAGLVPAAYRNTAGGTGRFHESTDPLTGFDLPVVGQGFLKFDQISGNADGFSDNDGGIAGLVNRDGVTGQSWCWFMVMRAFGRGPAAAGATAFGTVLGGRKTAGTNKGYGFFTRSGGGLTTWTTNIWWVVGTTAFGVSGTQNIPIGTSSDNWVVYAVQSEPGVFRHGCSRDYQNLDVDLRTGDIRYRDAVDGAPHMQIGLDGSDNGGGDTDHAEHRWFNRALSPAEFNLVMAELLVKYDMPVL